MVQLNIGLWYLKKLNLSHKVLINVSREMNDYFEFLIFYFL